MSERCLGVWGWLEWAITVPGLYEWILPGLLTINHRGLLWVWMPARPAMAAPCPPPAPAQPRLGGRDTQRHREST